MIYEKVVYRRLPDGRSEIELLPADGYKGAHAFHVTAQVQEQKYVYPGDVESFEYSIRPGDQQPVDATHYNMGRILLRAALMLMDGPIEQQIAMEEAENLEGRD